MMPKQNEIFNTFARYAHSYEKLAIAQNVSGDRLLERLQLLSMKPEYILDLGCGTGRNSLLLKKMYPKASIIAIDRVISMLQIGKSRQKWRKKWSLIQADGGKLPFKENTFDLIFCNQMIHWHPDLISLFREILNILSPQGCFMFTTLGPYSLQEIKRAFRPIDNFAHTNEFRDMHDIGDDLLRSQFSEPVVDMEMLTLQYKNAEALLSSVKKQGVRLVEDKRQQGLTTPRKWQQVLEALNAQKMANGKIPLSYEVIYGHAWKGEAKSNSSANEVFIPIANITKK